MIENSYLVVCGNSVIVTCRKKNCLFNKGLQCKRFNLILNGRGHCICFKETGVLV